MNEQNLHKILQSFKSIKPDCEYSKNSKTAIMNSEQKSAIRSRMFLFGNFSEILKISAVIGVVGFLLLFLMGGVSYINKNFSPLGLEGLSQKSLVTEAKDINDSIEITLKQIKYLDQSNQTAINTMTAVSKSQPIYSTTTITATSTTATSTPTDDISKFLISTSSTNATESADSLLDKVSQ